MKLIERYIFRRTLGLCLSSLFVVTFIVLTTQLLLYVNVLTQSGQALAAFLKLALSLAPGMILIVMPFAVILGASNTLNRMNNDSELAVLEAAGAGRKLIVRPVILIALGAIFLSLFIAQVADPWTNRIRRDLLVEAGADLVRIAIQSGNFQKIDENLHVQVAKQLPGGGLGGIFLADRRDKQTELIYYAKSGILSNASGRTLIMMNDGEIHRRSVETGEVSIISFASYALDMTQYGPAAGSKSYRAKERSTWDLLYPDPNDILAKNSPATVREEIHKRFSEWLYPLAFGLISIFFAGTARANRQERIWSMFAVFCVAFLIRGAGFVANGAAGTSTFMALASYLIPIGTILVFALLLVSGRSLIVPQVLIERTNLILVWFEIKLSGLQRRFAGNHGSGA